MISPVLMPAEASQGNGSAVVGVEALGLDHGLADETETALPTVLGRVILGRLLDSGGCGEDVQLAVGENAVYVEEKQFDFPGAKSGG